MLLYNHDAALTRWAGDRIGISDFGPSTTIGVVRGQELVAVAVFHQFRWPNIEITFVTSTRHWATPQVVRGIFRYPFIQLGCKRLTAITHGTNQPARAFLCRIGFREEGVHPDAFEDGDAVTYGLLRKEADRWLTEENHSGQKLAESSAGT